MIPYLYPVGTFSQTCDSSTHISCTGATLSYHTEKITKKCVSKLMPISSIYSMYRLGQALFSLTTNWAMEMWHGMGLILWWIGQGLVLTVVSRVHGGEINMRFLLVRCWANTVFDFTLELGWGSMAASSGTSRIKFDADLGVTCGISTLLPCLRFF